MFRKKDKDQIANRLASISNASAKAGDVRISEIKTRSSKKGRAPREPVFRPGKIFLSKTHNVRCVIRNVSATGAYVHMDNTHPLPERVVLHFTQSGLVKKCRVVWQKEVEAGLEFIDPDQAGGDG